VYLPTKKNFTGNYVLSQSHVTDKKTSPILCPFKAFPKVTLLSQSHVTDKLAGSIVFSYRKIAGSYPAVVTIVRAGEILEIGFYKGDVR
jgi:hypothetical protein